MENIEDIIEKLKNDKSNLDDYVKTFLSIKEIENIFKDDDEYSKIKSDNEKKEEFFEN